MEFTQKRREQHPGSEKTKIISSIIAYYIYGLRTNTMFTQVSRVYKMMGTCVDVNVYIWHTGGGRVRDMDNTTSLPEGVLFLSLSFYLSVSISLYSTCVNIRV